MNTRTPSEGEGSSFHYILGIRFFSGDAQAAVQRMSSGGLLVVPAAPALKDLATSAPYREALLNADLAIADSGLMVMVWNMLERRSIRKLSGLTYLRELLKAPDIRQPHHTFWVMADEASTQKNLSWLQEQGFRVEVDDTYIAPIYGSDCADEVLLDRLCKRQPAHVIITLGGGTQERLGLYLKRHLAYSPAIHCIGAAIAFLSGDQVRIPVWADKAYLGWLFRCISNPRRYASRYWEARKLVPLLIRYRDRLPVDG